MEWSGRFAKESAMEKFIAQLPGVQDAVQDVAVTIADRADRSLRVHRADGVAKIEVSEGKRTDWYVDLVDRAKGNQSMNPKGLYRGYTNSAAAIEYGRAGFIDPDTGETYGKSDGLWILHDAAKLPRRGNALKKIRARSKKSKTSITVNRKPRRGKG